MSKDLQSLFNKIGGKKNMNSVVKNVTTMGVGLSKSEAFCMRLRDFIESEEHLLQFIEVVSNISEDKLMGQFSVALKNIDGFYKIIESYRDIDKREAEEMLQTSKDDREGNMLASIQRLLWESGDGILHLGVRRPDINSLHVSDDVKGALSRYTAVVENAYTAKIAQLKNAYERILNCLPVTETRLLINDTQKREFVDKILDSFVKGKLNVKFDVSKFKYPKESAAFVPCTLESKEWLAEMVHSVIKYEFGGDVLVAFKSTDIMDVRRAKDSSYILFSDDPNSPYSLECSPSLYCQEMVDQQDGTSLWSWRNDQATINKQVNVDMTQREENNSTVREEVHRQREKEAAMKYVSDKDSILWKKEYLGVLGNTLAERVGSELIMKFFKRGLSKGNQVLENPGYIHLVSSSTARDMSQSDYYPFLLSDWNTVILFPIELWSVSLGASSGKQSKYATTYGMKNLPMNNSSLMAYSAFYGLAHIREMFRALRENETYDYEAYAYELISIALEEGSYPALFSSTRNNVQERGAMLQVFTAVFPGPLMGVYIAPQSTKVGKASRQEYMKDAGFSKHFKDIDTAEGIRGRSRNVSINNDRLKVFANVSDNHRDVDDMIKGEVAVKKKQPVKKKRKPAKKKNNKRSQAKVVDIDQEATSSVPSESKSEEHDDDLKPTGKWVLRKRGEIPPTNVVDDSVTSEPDQVDNEFTGDETGDISSELGFNYFDSD